MRKGKFWLESIGLHNILPRKMIKKVVICFLLTSLIFSCNLGAFNVILPKVPQAQANPGTKTKTVEFFVGQDQTAAGIAAGANWSPAAFTVDLPDAITSANVIKSAWIDYTFQMATTTAPGVVTLGLTPSGMSETTFTSASYLSSAENYSIRIKPNFTNAVKSKIQGPGAYIFTFRANVAGTARKMENAKIFITYDYDDSATTQVNTIRYRIGQSTGNVAVGTTGITFASPTMTVVENSPTIVSAWAEIRGQVPATGTTDSTFAVNYDSDVASNYYLDNVGGTDSQAIYILHPKSTITLNATHNLKIAATAGYQMNLVSAEQIITYKFNYTNSTSLMQSIEFMLGSDGTRASATPLDKTDIINIPEDSPTFRNIFLRGTSHAAASGTLNLAARLGGTVPTPATNFTYTAATEIQNNLWILSGEINDLGSMVQGDNQISATFRGTLTSRTMQLVITYSFAKSSPDRSASATFWAEQQTAYGTSGTPSVNISIAGTPESTTFRSFIWANSVNGVIQDRAVSISTQPTAATTYNWNSTGEYQWLLFFHKNEANEITGSGTYTLNLNATGNNVMAAVVQVYWQHLSPGISAKLNKYTESWFGEVEIRGTLSGLSETDYSYCRALVTAPSTQVYYVSMPWVPANTRFEGTFRVDQLGVGLADPSTGTYNVQVQLDNNSDFSSIDYTSNTSFSTVTIRRATDDGSADDNYADFIPTWNVDHWDYSITDFMIRDTAVRNNIIVKLPVYPTTASISNLSVTNVSMGAVNSYSYDGTDKVIKINVNTINGHGRVNISFDSNTDLFATRIDQYWTGDIGERDFYNGMVFSNRYISIFMFGGGHEGAGEYVDMHSKDSGLERTLDCMERVAVHVDDTMRLDTSSYYSADIKWRQDEWQNWILSQSNNAIRLENNSDPTASTGWRQQLDTAVSCKRIITFYASKQYVGNEYYLTNNDSVSHKYPIVWGREQWIYPGRQVTDQGIYADEGTDATIESRRETSLMNRPWFTAYDTSSFNAMGVIFRNTNLSDYCYFLRADTTVNGDELPLHNAASAGYGEWPINYGQSNTVCDATFFEKSWPTVGASQTVGFVFWQWGGKYTTRADIVSALDSDSDSLNSPTVNIAPASASSSGAANTTVTYTYTVTNNAGSTDTIYLNTYVRNRGWSAQITNLADEPISSVTLGASASVDIKVKVTIPNGTTEGTQEVTKLIATSTLNGTYAEATATTTCTNISASITINEAYNHSNVGGSDTTPPIGMAFGNVEPLDPYNTYIIGETANPYALKLTVTVSGGNYNLRCNAQGNFDPGTPGNPLDDISITQLFHALHAASHAEGDWTTFSTGQQDLDLNHVPGTVVYQYDYRLRITWDQPAGNNYQATIQYTVTAAP